MYKIMSGSKCVLHIYIGDLKTVFELTSFMDMFWWYVCGFVCVGFAELSMPCQYRCQCPRVWHRIYFILF